MRFTFSWYMSSPDSDVEFAWNEERSIELLDFTDTNDNNTLGAGIFERREPPSPSHDLHPWCNLFQESFEGLSQNQKPSVKSLKLHQFPCYINEACVADVLTNLLGTLEKVSLLLWSSKNHRGWKTFRCKNYEHLIRNMGGYFFWHLKDLTSLHWASPKEGEISNDRCSYYDTGLTASFPTLMPLLRRFHLERMTIDRNLSSFLEDHINTLESIKLTYCMVPRGSITRITWEDFFACIIRARPQKLIRLQIEPLNGPFRSEHREEAFCPTREEEEKAVQDALDADSTRRVFMYAFIRAVSGSEPDPIINRMRFLEGADQAAYDKLMKIVEANLLANRPVGRHAMCCNTFTLV